MRVGAHGKAEPPAGHPDVQGEHVMVLAGEDLVAHLNDQLIARLVEPAAGMVRGRRRFLQDRVGSDHFAWHQVFADAEVLE
jgi:hypothetical protein